MSSQVVPTSSRVIANRILRGQSVPHHHIYITPTSRTSLNICNKYRRGNETLIRLLEPSVLSFFFFVGITNCLKYGFYCIIMCTLCLLFMSSSSRASCVSYVLFCIIFNYTTILGSHLENHFVTSTSFKFVNTRLNAPLIWIRTTIQDLKASIFHEWDW